MKFQPIDTATGGPCLPGCYCPKLIPGNQKIIPSPWLPGSWYCEELLIKIPVIKELGIFYQSRYCKVHSNWGPGKQEPPVIWMRMNPRKEALIHVYGYIGSDRPNFGIVGNPPNRTFRAFFVGNFCESSAEPNSPNWAQFTSFSGIYNLPRRYYVVNLFI